MAGVEHGKAFEKRNRLCAVAGFARAGFFGFGNETVGIDDGRAALALADAAARLQRLPKGQPCLRRKRAVDHCAPQYQDIDARIGATGQRVAREARTDGTRDAPRLHPRHPPRFHFGNDALRDALIQIGLRRADLVLAAAALPNAASRCGSAASVTVCIRDLAGATAFAVRALQAAVIVGPALNAVRIAARATRTTGTTLCSLAATGRNVSGRVHRSPPAPPQKTTWPPRKAGMGGTLATGKAR